jgi:hypothetical protein
VEFLKQVLFHKKREVGGVPLEVLQEKRGVGLQLHVFLGAEFVELDVFGTVELERSWKNRSRSVPNTPLGCVWHGFGSAKPTLELLLHQFVAPSWS